MPRNAVFVKSISWGQISYAAFSLSKTSVPSEFLNERNAIAQADYLWVEYPKEVNSIRGNQSGVFVK
jgi:hypothetical protein